MIDTTTMDGFPITVQRMLIQMMLLRYKRLLEQIKDVYKVSEEDYAKLCDLCLNPEWVTEVLRRPPDDEEDL